MLHKSAVEPGALTLLESLMEKALPSEYYLAGGTALALHIGHRVSVDLDFFSPSEFDPEALFSDLEIEVPELK